MVGPFLYCSCCHVRKTYIAHLRSDVRYWGFLAGIDSTVSVNQSWNDTNASYLAAGIAPCALHPPLFNTLLSPTCCTMICYHLLSPGLTLFKYF